MRPALVTVSTLVSLGLPPSSSCVGGVGVLVWRAVHAGSGPSDGSTAGHAFMPSIMSLLMQAGHRVWRIAAGSGGACRAGPQ